MRLKFFVDYLEINPTDRCPIINMETKSTNKKEDFSYSNIYNMYKTNSTIIITLQGHGIQVNDKKLEKPYLKMCDKIAQTVYDFQKEIKNVKS